MAHAVKAIALLATLALAACNNPDRYGAGGPGGAGGAGGIGAGGIGSASDPNSPAYFNQTVGDRVFFAVDQSTISGEAAPILAAQAQWLNSHPEYTVIIEGHADEQGTREYNVSLSGKRANAARDYLISQGVSSNRIIRTVPWGKEKPVAVCPQESCFAQNRRAVTVLQMGAGM